MWRSWTFSRNRPLMSDFLNTRTAGLGFRVPVSPPGITHALRPLEGASTGTAYFPWLSLQNGTKPADRLSNGLTGPGIAVRVGGRQPHRAVGEGRFLWQSQRRPSALSGRQAPFSSSKRSKGCRAGAWRRLTGLVRGTSPSSRSRRKGHTASFPAIPQGRFCDLATRLSSTRTTTKNKKLSSLRSA